MNDVNKQTSTSDGSSADYYVLPAGAGQLQDLISYRNMNAQIGEIFRACYRYGKASHSAQLRDAKKILFYAHAEVKRLEREAEETQEAACRVDRYAALEELAQQAQNQGCYAANAAPAEAQAPTETPIDTRLPLVIKFISSQGKLTSNLRIGIPLQMLCWELHNKGFVTDGIEALVRQYFPLIELH